MLHYTTTKTAAGWLGILASTRGLRAITLPQRSRQEAARRLGARVNQAVRSPRRFRGLAGRLKAYFSGQQVTFPDELDLEGATPFQRQVWASTRLIHCGETRSYAWVAGQIKRPKAVRAVGQALGRNPLPIIIPCHRVVASDGTIGGFRGGVGMKKHLLSREAQAGI